MTPGDPPCIHHWLIESAEGPLSTGVCQDCGATREFQNHFAGGDWRIRSRVEYGLLRDGATNRDVQNAVYEVEAAARQMLQDQRASA